VFFALDVAQHERVPAAFDAGALLAVVASGWPGRSALGSDRRVRCLEVQNPLFAFRRLAATLRRRFGFPVIAVGGSNGKTTTKELIAAMLSGGGRSVTCTPGTNNGWLGVPLTL